MSHQSVIANQPPMLTPAGQNSVLKSLYTKVVGMQPALLVSRVICRSKFAQGALHNLLTQLQIETAQNNDYNYTSGPGVSVVAWPTSP